MDAPNKLKVAFLDRDGTINVDNGFVHRIDDWQLIPAAEAALMILQAAGFRLAVVTNQSGIAAGMFTSADVEKLHAHMCEQLAQSGIQISAVAFCPHSPTKNCECRKPRLGLAQVVGSQLGEPIECSSSWTIGDKIGDIEFGRGLGTKTALIRSRYWTESDHPDADLIVNSLYDAAQKISVMCRP